MAQSTRILTAGQLLAMPDDGQRYELVAGELRMMSPAGGLHGRIALKLGRMIGNHVEHNQLGETFAAETGFLLRRDPDTVLAPDVAFVSWQRLGDRANEPGYLPIAPDLVAEVVSPSERMADVLAKVNRWLTAGVEAVLVVDPQEGTVVHHQPSAAPRTYVSGSVDLSSVLAGYGLDVSEVFS